MQHSAKILGPASGRVLAEAMFIGEAPGRLGADDTGIPFYGDKSGHNFEALLEFANISRSEIFVTNAVLCNPRSEDGNNATPKTNEIANCSAFLKQQIDVVDPKIIVTIGATALRALTYIEPHKLTLKESVRTRCNWYGRILIPIYHPGQRAMLHRSFINQQSDYKFISDVMKSQGVKKKKVYGKVGESLIDLVQYILNKQKYISYFALHKIVYLVEYNLHKTHGILYTGAYFIRQKDGPYCTNLHIQKIKNTFKDIHTSTIKKKLYLEDSSSSLFPEPSKLSQSQDPMDQEACAIVDELLEKTDEELKKKSYLSKPMRKAIRKERKDGVGTYNAQLAFEEG